MNMTNNVIHELAKNYLEVNYSNTIVIVIVNGSITIVLL